MSVYMKVFAALVIGGSSLAMIAAEPPVDSNGDGVVSRAEFNKAAVSKFDAADANSDGIWTAEEMRNFEPVRKAAREARQALRRASHNFGEWGQQDVASEQMRARVNSVLKTYGFDTSVTFDSIDTDANGRISAEERAAVLADYRQISQVPTATMSYGDNSVAMKLHTLGPIEQMDMDADGQISQAEYMTLTNMRFGDFDVNNDGQISGDESPSQGERQPS